MSDPNLIGCDLESRIQLFLDKHQDLLTRWSAGLKSLLEAPDPFRKTRGGTHQFVDSRSSGDYHDFKIQLCREVTIPQMKILILLSWFIDEEIGKILRLSVLEDSKRRRLLDHPDIPVLMESKVYALLFYQHRHKTYNSLFGELMMIIQAIQKEVESFPTKRIKGRVFSLPFWKLRTDDSPNDYTGWARHQRKTSACDQSSNRSKLIDQTREHNRRLELIEQNRKLMNDTFQLIKGFIE